MGKANLHAHAKLSTIQLRIALKLAVSLSILLVVSPSVCFAKEQILSIEEVTQIDLGTEINCIAINEKLNRIYVAVNDTVIVINGTSKQVMKTVKIDFTPYMEEVEWLVVDSLNNQIWAIVNGHFYVIDGETYAIRDTLHGGGSRWNFALDPSRERVYLTKSAWTQGEFDKVSVYSPTDFTELGHIDIPGSDAPTTVQYFGILLDTELNRIYVDWTYTTFVFDCASESLILNCSSPSNFVNIYTTPQFYEDKIYTPAGIMDANTLQYILYFNNNAIKAFDPRNSIVYGFYWDGKWESDVSLQAIDALTNKTLASSDDIFTYDDHEAILNLQTGEIYLGGKSGLLHIMTVSEQEESTTTGFLPPEAFCALAIIGVVAIIAIARVALKRRKK